MSPNMNESMTLEFDQSTADVFDDILMKNILAFCGLPSSCRPSRNPLGQAVDGIVRIGIQNNVLVEISVGV
jgi:hypothetical protein